MNLPPVNYGHGPVAMVTGKAKHLEKGKTVASFRT